MTFEELQKAFSLEEGTIEKLRIYAKLLKEWNEKINLTSIVEEEEVVEKHIYDSLLPSKVFKFTNQNLIDMGTGAGFPGLVLAICFPELHVTLLDATKKKFSFLEEVVKQTETKNVTFLCARAEDLRTFREHYDMVTARGFSALQNIIELGVPLLKVNGILLAYKGDKGMEELRESERALRLLRTRFSNAQKEELPGGAGMRINLFFKKQEKTMARYPRPWNQISKHSL